jgi:hypothetical protein
MEKEKITLNDLACTSPDFRMWINAMTSNPDHHRYIMLIGDSGKFEKLLTESEKVRFNAYLMNEGPTPEWVKISQQSQSQAEKIIQLAQRTVGALGGMTVMCDACGGQQPKGTKCFKTGAYHM